LPKEAYNSIEEVAQHIGAGASIVALLEKAGVLSGLKPSNQISFFEG
jgi:DNA polymerase III alpha subunit (gram-positive type)